MERIKGDVNGKEHENLLVMSAKTIARYCASYHKFKEPLQPVPEGRKFRGINA